MMYYWAHSEPILQTLEILPRKITQVSWPPLKSEDDAEFEKDKNKLVDEGEQC